MIKVSIESKEFKLDGDLPVLLTELEFIVADIYITMLGRGISNRDIDDIFDEVRKNGLENAWNVIKKEEKLSGNCLLKDLGAIPDVLQ